MLKVRQSFFMVASKLTCCAGIKALGIISFSGAYSTIWQSSQRKPVVKVAGVFY
jgi:hypothetical protein